MYSKNDILEQLRKGANASDIAQKMADEINAAVREYDEEQEAKKAAVAAEKAKSEKREAAKALIIHLNDFIGDYLDDTATMSPEEVDEATDALIELMDHMVDLKNSIGMLGMAKFSTGNKNDASVKKCACGAPDCNDEIDDDVLKRFIASL